MNKFKKTAALLMAICFMFSFSACFENKEEYETIQGIELYFYPDEYEEEYSKISETLCLNENTDYILELEATCESAQMEIEISYNNEQTKTYTVSAQTPSNELLTICQNTTEEITITFSIEPDTKGKVFVNLSAKIK